MTDETPWSSNTCVENTTPDGHHPTLAASGDRLHALWSNQKTVYHAHLAAGVWSQPVRVASGEQPVVVADPDGQLHCLFVQWFYDTSNVYYVRWDGTAWSLPEVVSRTPGYSAHPALAIGPAGALHAAWDDTTPGYATIYHGLRQETAWNAVPIPNARGSYPALALTPGGELYLAWQDRLTATNKFEVFCSINNGTGWMPPENVSDAPAGHSIYPRLAISTAGAAHLLWHEEQEGLFGIRYADRRPGSWSQPVTLSTPGADCRLGQIAINRQAYPQAVWAEGGQLRHCVRSAQMDAPWRAAEAADGMCDGIDGLAACLAPDGQLHILWSGASGSEARQLYHLRREALFKHSVFIPFVQK